MKAKTVRTTLMFAWPVILFGGLFLFYQLSENSTGGAGAKLYTIYCANCHMEEGEGLRNLIPPLKNADYIPVNKESLACIIRNGQSGEIMVNDTVYNFTMPPNAEITPTEIATLLRYIFAQWYPEETAPTFSEIKEQLYNCPQNE